MTWAPARPHHNCLGKGGGADEGKSCKVAEPGGGWVRLVQSGVLQVSCFLEGRDHLVHVPYLRRGEGGGWVLVPTRKNAQPLCEEYVPCRGGCHEI